MNYFKRFFEIALLRAIIALYMIVVSAMSNAEITDLNRGLKSRVPVKPFYEEPRFEEPKPEPLKSEQVLPKVPEIPSQNTSITNSPAFKVKQIDIVGSTIFTEQELVNMKTPYEGRIVSIDELQAFRHALSLHYFRRGYINSGVIIPDQNVETGIVKFKVIEGQLTTLNLSGNADLVDDYLFDRIKLGVDQPLNVNALQQALRSLQQNRLIKKINAQLKPSKELGMAELDVFVTEAKAQRLSIAVDNYRTPSIGAEEITLNYLNSNLAGYGDALDVSYSLSDGLNSTSVHYNVPLTAEETSLSFFYNQSNSEVIEEPFDQIDIKSESRDFGFNLSTPLYIDTHTFFTFNTGMTFKDSDSFLLGEPFSFSAGAIEGQSKSSVLELGGSLVHRAVAEVYMFSLTARQGLDILDANMHPDSDIPDASFLSFLGQGQYASRLEFLPGSQVIARAALQLSLDPLLSIEKFSIGGHSTVRGYRENQLVRDNGFTGSIEFRYPLFADRSGNDPYHFQLAPFLDWGKAWDEDIPSQNDEIQTIYSVGIGFLWQPMSGLNVTSYWGEALEDDVKSDNGDDLQDKGIHFSITYSQSF